MKNENALDLPAIPRYRSALSKLRTWSVHTVAIRCWYLVPLLSCCLAGCLATSGEQGASIWTMRLRPELAPDVAVIEFTLVERELGDPFLNHDLWTHTDELFVDLEKKAALDDNGFRIGQVVGMTPADLHALLKSERWRLHGYHRVCPLGKTYTEYLSPVQIPHCDYDIVLGGRRHELQADGARFCLDLVPAFTGDGKTRLTFTPKVETAEQMLPFQPAPNESSWVFKPQRPGKAYQELSWHATLAPNEYLVIGPRLDKPGMLGYRALVQDEGPQPMQRLLVIRTNRSLKNGPGDQPTLEDLARAGDSPTLAAQAAMGAVRASRP